MLFFILKVALFIMYITEIMTKFIVGGKYSIEEFVNEGGTDPTRYEYVYTILKREGDNVLVEALDETMYFSSSWDHVSEIETYKTKDWFEVFILNENGSEIIDIDRHSGGLSSDTLVGAIKLGQLCVCCKQETVKKYDISGIKPKYSLCNKCDHKLKPQNGYRDYIKFLTCHNDCRWDEKATQLKKLNRPITDKDKEYVVEAFDIDPNPRLVTCKCGSTYRYTEKKDMAHNNTAKHKKWSKRCQEYYAEKERKKREVRGEPVNDLF